VEGLDQEKRFRPEGRKMTSFFSLEIFRRRASTEKLEGRREKKCHALRKTAFRGEKGKGQDSPFPKARFMATSVRREKERSCCSPGRRTSASKKLVGKGGPTNFPLGRGAPRVCGMVMKVADMPKKGKKSPKSVGQKDGLRPVYEAEQGRKRNSAGGDGKSRGVIRGRSGKDWEISNTLYQGTTSGEGGQNE